MAATVGPQSGAVFSARRRDAAVRLPPGLTAVPPPPRVAGPACLPPVGARVSPRRAASALLRSSRSSWASLLEREFYRTTVRSDYSSIECSYDSVVPVAYDIFAARRTDV